MVRKVLGTAFSSSATVYFKSFSHLPDCKGNSSLLVLKSDFQFVHCFQDLIF